MAAITVQAEGRNRRIRMLVIAAVAVAVLLPVGALQLQTPDATTGGVVGTAPWKPISVSDVSERAVLIHQKVGAALARLDRTKADPTPVCLPCIARQHQTN